MLTSLLSLSSSSLSLLCFCMAEQSSSASGARPLPAMSASLACPVDLCPVPSPLQHASSTLHPCSASMARRDAAVATNEPGHAPARAAAHGRPSMPRATDTPTVLPLLPWLALNDPEPPARARARRHSLTGRCPAFLPCPSSPLLHLLPAALSPLHSSLSRPRSPPELLPAIQSTPAGAMAAVPP